MPALPVVTAQLEPEQAEPQFPPLPGERQRRDPERERLERDMEKQRNKERQAALKQDTDKLLKLATELKQYVDKTNENVMSLDVIKKADEIEKLAKSVRDKMKAE
jgi:hypothetical protein